MSFRVNFRQTSSGSPQMQLRWRISLWEHTSLFQLVLPSWRTPFSVLYVCAGLANLVENAVPWWPVVSDHGTFHPLWVWSGGEHGHAFCFSVLRICVSSMWVLCSVFHHPRVKLHWKKSEADGSSERTVCEDKFTPHGKPFGERIMLTACLDLEHWSKDFVILPSTFKDLQKCTQT